jgi:hypothetical protein
MAADALRQSAHAASEPEKGKETRCPRRSANTRATTASRRCKKGQSGNPRGRPKKTLPGLLLAALNEPVFVTIDGKRRKITKREVIVT